MHDGQEDRSAGRPGFATNQAPLEDSQPFPALTTLLIAIIISATKWVDWILQNIHPIVTSPRFTGAVKDAGSAAFPILQKVACDVWKWYTTAEQAETVKLGLPKHATPCNTTQSFTFGVSMPGVSLNMQYQATSTPQLGSQTGGLPAAIEARHQNVEAINAQERLALEGPREAGPQLDPAHSSSLLGLARESVAVVSSLPIRTIALAPLQTALHPVRTCNNIWQVSRYARADAAAAAAN
ncbi:hypothetical protein P389DRAFT_172973 [Cystobasidium minutum MCA 4210]|uniref:uncharacterized protein n=1 Tax=Cystobasidium minutum MCA 4210 TaxID=1397322 RepID=UPI0034CD2516|eukprot:jgi/Rhomi1/172973/fgenesh1_kg.5_\